MPENDAEPTEWWNTVGLHTYAHPTHEVEDMGHPDHCLRRPDGQWFTLRATAPAMFLDLWDDGLGEPVIPCPGDHIAIPQADSHGFTLPYRLADAVEVRREDLEHQPGLLSMIYADMARPGSVDWSTLGHEPTVSRGDDVHFKNRSGYPQCGGQSDNAVWEIGKVTCEDCIATTRPPGTYDNAEAERGALWDLIQSGYITHDPPPPTLADHMREAVSRALTVSYEPTGLILGPEDYRHVDAADRVARVPAGDPYRRANQQRIAEAYGIPGWMLGVEGAKAPLRLRARWTVRRIPRRLLTLLPLVTYWGPRETGEGWMNAEPAEPRAWRWGAHVGNYRIGTTPHDPWSCGDDECTEAHP